MAGSSSPDMLQDLDLRLCGGNVYVMTSYLLTTKVSMNTLTQCHSTTTTPPFLFAKWSSLLAGRMVNLMLPFLHRGSIVCAQLCKD